MQVQEECYLKKKKKNKQNKWIFIISKQITVFFFSWVRNYMFKFCHNEKKNITLILQCIILYNWVWLSVILFWNLETTYKKAVYYTAGM